MEQDYHMINEDILFKTAGKKKKEKKNTAKENAIQQEVLFLAMVSSLTLYGLLTLLTLEQ